MRFLRSDLFVSYTNGVCMLRITLICVPLLLVGTLAAQSPAPFSQLPISPRIYTAPQPVTNPAPNIAPANDPLPAALPAQLNPQPVLGQQLGGLGNPNRFPGFGQPIGNGNNQPFTHAPQLIDVIQGTIAPTSWNVNGGHGAAFYYHSVHALVIRQTEENHEKIGGLLEALRRAGN
jgi:hypothetical protein